MGRDKKKIEFFITMIFMFLLVCGFSLTAEAAGKAAISKKSATIYVGKTVKLSMKNVKKGLKTVWASSNPSVASVSSSGKVTGKKAGTAVITAKVNRKSYSCKVTVKVKATKVKKVKLSKTKVTLKVNQTYQLKAAVTPGNATNKKVTWKSSNNKVATVDAKGKVTAKKAGSVTITATAADGSKKKSTCKITVKSNQVKVKSVKLNKGKASLALNQTYQLKAVVSPGNATNQKVTWKSSNNKVAMVDAKGKVTAKKAGSATITATAADGSKKKAACKLTVKNVKVKSVAITGSRNMKVGEVLQLGKKVLPSGANNLFAWKSSNSSIASVDGNGKVTAKKAGTVKITVTATDGSRRIASCTFKVTKPQTASAASAGNNTQSSAKPSTTGTSTSGTTSGTSAEKTSGTAQGTSSGSSSSTINPDTPSGITSLGGKNETAASSTGNPTSSGSSNIGSQSGGTSSGSGNLAGTSSAETETETQPETSDKYYYDMSEVTSSFSVAGGKTYQLLVYTNNPDASRVTYSVSSGSEFVTISESNCWKELSSTEWYYSITVKGKYAGTATIAISAGDKSKTVTVKVTSDDTDGNNFERWVEEEFAVLSGFNSGATPLEKLVNVTKYIATTYDYNGDNHGVYAFWPEYMKAHNLPLGGSCTASTSMIRYFARKLGLKNESYFSDPRNINHISAYVVIEGEEYLFEAGISGVAPRAWNVYKRDADTGYFMTIFREN